MSSDGTPLLTDIGLNHLPTPPYWTIAAGRDVRWLAPELAMSDVSRGDWENEPQLACLSTLKSDVYSFGMLMLEVFFISFSFPVPLTHA